MTIVAARPGRTPTKTLPASPPGHRSRWARLVRGPVADPAWVRPTLVALLSVTAVGYLWALDRSGWGNPYYAAAVQAGSHSVKALFFGSADGGNFLTVDKPPASLWVMDLSARMFGLNSWSVLAPQALEGVGTVGLVYLTIRRWFTPGAALLGAMVTATTPVAVAMFRFDNPDALLTLLLTFAVYATVRSIDEASTGWLLLAGAAIGGGFLTKMLEAFLVVPAIALAYLLAAPSSLRRRLWRLCGFAGAVIVFSGWWVAAVQLTPVARRPFIGSTPDNNLFGLIVGYNGLGRLSGNEAGGGVTLRPGASWGPVGLLRMFGADVGGQVSWLLPAALVFLVFLLWRRRRSPRSDRTRAVLVLAGTWLVVTALVFSYAKGIFHPYYAVVVAPALGILVGVGAKTCWAARQGHVAERAALAVVVQSTGAWAFTLLARQVDPMPWLADTVFAGSLLLAIAIVLGRRLSARSSAVVAATAVVLCSAGPIASSISTIGKPETGGNPTAGPQMLRVVPPLPPPPVSRRVVALLDAGADGYRWAAATAGGDPAARYQLACGRPVMNLGGFHGTLPVPELGTFEREVAGGNVHFLIVSQRDRLKVPASSAAGRITTWVEANYRALTIGDLRLYDLHAARIRPA